MSKETKTPRANGTVSNTAEHVVGEKVAASPNTENQAASKIVPAEHPTRRSRKVRRIEVAELFERLRKERVAAGDLTCTRESLARAFDVTEKRIFTAEDGEASTPLDWLAEPKASQALRDDIARKALALGCDTRLDRESVVNLGHAIQRARRYVEAAALTGEQREALGDALRRFADELSALAAEVGS